MGGRFMAAGAALMVNILSKEISWWKKHGKKGQILSPKALAIQLWTVVERKGMGGREGGSQGRGVGGGEGEGTVPGAWVPGEVRLGFETS